MKHRTLPLALALVLGLGACTTMTDTQRNAGLGAVGGAVGGALIGKPPAVTRWAATPPSGQAWAPSAATSGRSAWRPSARP